LLPITGLSEVEAAAIKPTKIKMPNTEKIISASNAAKKVLKNPFMVKCCISMNLKIFDFMYKWEV
jgi:hypothetical protein